MRDAGGATHGERTMEAHGRSAQARVALLERRAARPSADDPVESALTVAAAVDLRRRSDHALRMARIRGSDPDVDAVDALLEHLDVAIERFTANVGGDGAFARPDQAVATGRVSHSAATRRVLEALRR